MPGMLIAFVLIAFLLGGNCIFKKSRFFNDLMPFLFNFADFHILRLFYEKSLIFYIHALSR